ncbi:mediator of RNA polymerase II transcription subunit 13-like isoform X2 [Frankliniella occidentalis]|uniref:Mediator of RNA polymerase II transcription subunit 13 n=1 Tax=Frankliniella occidentalis TaxID=133901 RepID=A0A6J1TEA0_FRAOC|nr:mediator of RNA polymerase II transcription subunit 13-like isoform X2 [Frankliniella occidentalis]
MTHPNHQTNGASLEDCHTNFFALTDLCGIKWRKLVWPEAAPAAPAPEVVLDPVLLSFSRCLHADILCVWRRVGRRPPPPDDSALLDAPLGAPPPPVAPSIVVHPPLALHAAKELWIFWYGEEPDLSSLVVPDLLNTESEQGSWESGLSYECRSLLFKALHNLIERCLLSRDLIRLGRWFVLPYEGTEEVEGKSPHLSFLFSFFVHGESTVCASVDVRQHPPVRTLSSQVLQQAQSSQAGVPVILAPFGLAGTLSGQSFKAVDQRTSRLLEDWKQFYPIDSRSSNCDDSSTPQAVEVIVGGVKMRYPSCYVLVTDMDDTPSNNLAQNPPKAAGLSSEEPSPVPPVESPCLRQQSSATSWVKQEPPSPPNLADITWQESMLSPPSDPSDVPPGHWDFVDPTRKLPCSCSKCRQVEGKGGPGSRSLIPFHQRAPPRHIQPAKPVSRMPCGAGHTTPMPERSPQSAAPSPLPNPNSVQPASVPPAEPTMPTLSPQPSASSVAGQLSVPATPPPAPGPGTPAHTPLDSHGPKSVSSVSNQVYSPYQGPVSVSSVDNSGMTGGPPSAPPGPPGPAPAQPPSGPPEHQPLTLKRPVLTAKEYEHLMHEDEALSDNLYDYSQLDVWLNYPVKKFKPSDIEQKPWPKASNSNDIYPAVQPPAASPPVNGLPATPGTPAYAQAEVKQEQMEDDRADNSGKCLSGSLFTSEGLQASFRDLDQIFDNSDTSSDETMQVPTPPGSKGNEDNSCNMRGPRILRPEELSKMFPTPPSLEHNPASSPCGGQTDIDRCDFTELPVARFKQEIYPNMGSPQEEVIDDWSYVFRPPTLYKFVGSSKYAPLRDLPSQHLPPVSLPGNCSYKPSWLYPPVQEKAASR